MAKARRGYRCSQCGWESSSFEGKCRQCGGWNVLEPFAESSSRFASVVAGAGGAKASGAAVSMLADDAPDDGIRRPSGIPEFDRVLGGGVVPGSVVLVGGEPGIGKSTLMLQAAARLADGGARVAYVCGEESPRQVRMRATRLGLGAAAVHLVSSPTLEPGLAAADEVSADVLIVDSIQAMPSEGIESRAGGPAQLAEAGAKLVSWAKSTGTATFLTGHVTKTGEIAGPRLLEHLVDAVLYFESGDSGPFRILRAVKNRFGATDEVGVFEMTAAGLVSVEDPGRALLEGLDHGASGSAVTAVIEGSRPLVIEVQALAVPSTLATPRRIASGIETSRMHLLLAVAARRAGITASQMDVVASVSAGMRLRDPGSDLAVLCALASAITDQPVRPRLAMLGEVALSGMVRPVQQPQRRLLELARLGFAECLVAAGTPDIDQIRSRPVRTVREACTTALDA